jgi:hypothetical protein
MNASGWACSERRDRYHDRYDQNNRDEANNSANSVNPTAKLRAARDRRGEG